MQDMPHLKEMVQSMKVSDCKMQNVKHKFGIFSYDDGFNRYYYIG